MNPIDAAKKWPRSRDRAIKAMCYQCQGEDYDPGWKWRIGNCEIGDCALWHLRPYRRLEGTDMPKFLQKSVNISTTSVLEDS